MEFSKNFRTLWWGILVITIGFYIYRRLDALVIGESKTADVIVFLVWVGVCLGPLFKEIELPGIKLKQEIEELKKEFQGQIAVLRNDLRLNADVRSNVSPNFWFGMPPADSKLPAIEENIKKVIEETFTSYGFSQDGSARPEMGVDTDVMFLFQARHNIEKELRILASAFEDNPRFTPLPHMLRHLTSNEVITTNMAGAIREVYSVCSPAIHGEPVTKEQVQFVKDTAPELIAALRSITRRNV